MGKRLIIIGANFSANAIDRIDPSGTYYSVTYNLTNATASTSVSVVEEGSSYTVTLTPNSGYPLLSVVVTHDGVPVQPVGNDYTYTINSVEGNIVITAIARSYTDMLIQGFWVPISTANPDHILRAVITGYDADANVHRFVATTKDGLYTAIGFDEGELTITIPANCTWRVVMSKHNDGSATGYVASDALRTESLATTRDIKVNSLSIPSILGASASVYPYWGINIKKSNDSDSTPSDMDAYGVSVIPTNGNVVISQGFWANHAIDSTSSTALKYVNAAYNGGFIPFSAGEYQIIIPAGLYRVILSSVIDGSTGTMCRTNPIVLSSATTISTNDLLSIMVANAAEAASGTGMDAYDSSTTYLGWSIHYSVASPAATTTPAAAINKGLAVVKV